MRKDTWMTNPENREWRESQIEKVRYWLNLTESVLANRNNNGMTDEEIAEHEKRIAEYKDELARLHDTEEWFERISSFCQNLDLSGIVQETDVGKWVFDIEESEHLAEFGFVVLKNNKRKFYHRVRKLSEKEIEDLKKQGLDPEGYELIPISTEDMRKKGIQETVIEESENFAREQNEEIEIED